jgi:integrator complex subunit 3
MKHLLSRSVRELSDKFVVSILKYWSSEHEDKFAELIGSLLNSRYPNTSPNKRKRGGKGSTSSSGPPTADQVLGHLDHLRQSCQTADLRVYSLEPIQRALQVAQINCTDSQRQTYSDLFALAEVEDNKKVGRAGQKIGKSRSSKPKASLKEISDSSENSSEVSLSSVCVSTSLHSLTLMSVLCCRRKN